MVPYTDVIFSEQLIAPREQVQPKAVTYKVPIYACHLCSEIDYQSFCTEHRFKSRAWGRDNVLLEVRLLEPYRTAAPRTGTRKHQQQQQLLQRENSSNSSVDQQQFRPFYASTQGLERLRARPGGC